WADRAWREVRRRCAADSRDRGPERQRAFLRLCPPMAGERPEGLHRGTSQPPRRSAPECARLRLLPLNRKPTRRRPPMHHQNLEKLKRLRLFGMARALEDLRVIIEGGHHFHPRRSPVFIEGGHPFSSKWSPQKAASMARAEIDPGV